MEQLLLQAAKEQNNTFIRTYIYGICEQVLLRKESLDNCILIIKFTYQIYSK